jgi:hypothetical protein
MLMYDYKNGMQRCLFVDIDDPSFTCNDCDLKDTVCDGEFYKKYGILRREVHGANTRPKD